ncbi:FAD/NAD(P)-binding domain-containing protein [Meredithblackwellia eburnea MCA 4105]
MSSEPLRVIIVGAGIAGLAAARGLREHDVTVLEQSRMKSEIGAAIHLGSNASKIALRWGMDLKRLNSPEVKWYTELTKEGVVQIQAPVDATKGFGGPWLLNHRVDLHNELKRLAEDTEAPGKPAKIRSAARVVDVDCEAGTVTLADGEVVKGDLIIGADGIHSVVRTAVLGNKSIAQPSGHSAYRLLIPREKIINDEKLAFLVDGTRPGIFTYVSTDRRVVAYPCRGFQLLNIVAIVPDKFMEEKSTESWTAEGTIEELLGCFSEFSDDVKRLLSYAPSVGLWQLRDQDPIDTWVRGRAILIGDSAHAMLPHQGQGGGQSVEDAEALEALLAGCTAAEVTQRLPLVEKVRKERATMIQGFSRSKALGSRDGETFTLNASEFMPYNFGYEGALDWAKRQGIDVSLATKETVSEPPTANGKHAAAPVANGQTGITA